MKKILHILALFPLLTLSSHGHWSDSCVPSPVIQTPAGQCQSFQNAKNKNSKKSENYRVGLVDLSGKMVALLHSEIDREKNLFRYMRGLKGDPKSSELQKRYQLRRKKFDELARIITLENEYESKLDACYEAHCPRSWSLELEDKVNYLKNLKIYSLSATPELAQEATEELFQHDPPYSDKQIKKTLMNSSQEYLQARMRAIEQTNQYRMKLQLGASSNPFNTNPLVGDILFQSVEKITPKKLDISQDNLCLLKKQRDQYYHYEKMKSIAIEGAIFMAPFFIPPLRAIRMGRLAYLGAMGSKLRNVEILTESSLIKALQVSTVTYDLHEKLQQCQHIKDRMLLVSNEKNISEYEECKNNADDEKLQSLFLAGMAIVPFEKLSKISPENIKRLFSKNLPTLKDRVTNEGALPFINQTLAKSPSATVQTNTDDFLTVLDLSKVQGKNSGIYKEISSDYWKFVGETYQKRLKLSDDEIKGFLKSSRDFEDRTLLILKTKSHPANGPPKFNGGMGMVFSNKEKDLLPLEKATGYKIPRHKGEEVIEVVRLVVDDPKNPQGMNELKVQMENLLHNNRKSSSFFVYTSRIHERLYRKLGIPYEVVNRPNSRDVIMKFDTSAK